jgi:hypothetical protein
LKLTLVIISEYGDDIAYALNEFASELLADSTAARCLRANKDGLGSIACLSSLKISTSDSPLALIDGVLSGEDLTKVLQVE